MELEEASTAVSVFMKSPLVSWAKTFQDEEKKTLEFNGLCDGVFLYNVWLEIDPHPPYHGINVSTNDVTTRIRNLDVLLHNIKAFYEEVLGQLLLVRTPDIIALAKRHEGTSVDEMETMLLLILGCAVQCERKEHFIEMIKSMDLEVQHKIVDYIQQVTDNPEAVWTTEWSELSLIPTEDQEHMYSMLVQHLRRLVREKDEITQKIISTALRNISLSAGNHPPSPSSVSSLDKSHLIVELADVKARLRKLQQEVEEKNEAITELKEELELSKDAHSKLRQENLELIQDARTAKTYRDEIDILKERVRKVDRLESEIQRYKDKMNELDFYKSRVEELREDNRILVETKTMLEEQLEVSRKRAEQVMELEAEILKYCSQINELTIERESDRDRIQQLLEENAQLHIDRKSSMEELTQLQSELSQSLRHSSPLESHSLMEQLNTDAQTRVLQLELENQRLRILVDSLNRSPSFEVTDTESMQDMERYIDNLDHSILMDKGNGNLDNTVTMWKENKILKEQNSSLEKDIEEAKVLLKKLSPFEIQCQELEKIIEEQQRNLNAQKVDQNKCECLEHSVMSLTSENQKLQRMMETGQQRISELQQDLQGLESENQKLNNNVDSLKLSIRKYHDLERETTNLETVNHRLEQEMKGMEKENCRLKHSVEVKDSMIEGFSSRISYLERENKQLIKEVENLSQVASKVRELERENKDLNQQTAVDKKSLEALRHDLVSEKIAKQKLSSEIHKVKITRDNESSYEIFSHEREKQPNELKEADKFLIEMEPVESIDYRTTDNECCTTADEKTGFVSDLKTSDNEDYYEKQESETENRSEKWMTKENTLAELIEELNKLKLDVQELERRNYTIEEENCNLCNQSSVVKEQNLTLKSQLEGVEQHLATVLSQNSTLQSRLAKLEVEITLVTSQNTTLNSQNSTLQTQVSNLEEQNKRSHKQCEELQHQNEGLLNDYESMQRLHKQLSSDYDSLVKNHSSLKTMHKSLKVEHNSLKVDKLQAALFSQEEMNKLREVLEDDSPPRTDNRFPSNLRNEHMLLKDQLKNLKETYEVVTKELKSLQSVHKALKKENNELKLKYTGMQGELLECQNETSSLDVEVYKLTSCCELLSKKNTMLEGEQQSLMSHVSVLLRQYHELLYQVASEQGKVQKEETSFREKLWELCQQREKLEQKIIDHCKKLQKSPKRKHAPLSGSLRMRRTRSAFIRNAKHSDPLNFHSDNSTDSSLYCSFRRPKKPSNWMQLNKMDNLNAEDSSQEDHIPVRDVGLDCVQNADTALAVIQPQSSSKCEPDQNPHPPLIQHTEHVEMNNMTFNLVANLTNPSEGNGQSFLRNQSQPVPSYQPPHPLLSGTKNAFQSLAKIPANSDSSSNADSTEASKSHRSKGNNKTDPAPTHNNNNNNNAKDKCPENSIWYEYGCV